MYYYIFQQPKSIMSNRHHTRIKNILTILGIAGEMATVSPARTIPELVEIAQAKKYSTIVVVGSDYIINKVSSYLVGRECALGIIPIEASPLIYKIIGTDDIKTACQNLKLRRLKTVDTAYIYPNKFFLTEIKIASSKPTYINIEVDSYNTQTKFTSLSLLSPTLDSVNIDRDMQNNEKLNLYLENSACEPNIIYKTINWLIAKQKPNICKSVLRGEKINLNTNEPIPVLLDEKIISKTPITINIYPKALKIITTRASIVKDNILNK